MSVHSSCCNAYSTSCSPAARKTIYFQYEINLFSQHATSLSNASVPHLPFGWIQKTTGSLKKTALIQSTVSYNEHVSPMDHPLLCQFKCSLTWAKEKKSSQISEVKWQEAKGATAVLRDTPRNAGALQSMMALPAPWAPPQTGKKYSHILFNSSIAKIWVSINIPLKAQIAFTIHDVLLVS